MMEHDDGALGKTVPRAVQVGVGGQVKKNDKQENGNKKKKLKEKELKNN